MLETTLEIALLVGVLVGMVCLALRSRANRRSNPVVLRCSACKNECRRRPYGWSYVLGWVGWMGFCFTALRWTLPLPWGETFLVGICFAIPFDIAETRLYHAIWAWRHPTRCGGGGELEPQADVG